MSLNLRIYKTVQFLKTKNGQSYLRKDLPDYVDSPNDYKDIPCAFTLIETDSEKEAPVYEAKLLFNGLLLKRESRINRKTAALELILEIAERIEEASSHDHDKHESHENSDKN